MHHLIVIDHCSKHQLLSKTLESQIGVRGHLSPWCLWAPGGLSALIRGIRQQRWSPPVLPSLPVSAKKKKSNVYMLYFSVYTVRPPCLNWTFSTYFVHRSDMIFVKIHILLCSSVITLGSSSHLEPWWPLDTWWTYVSLWSPGALGRDERVVRQSWAR